jgi:hypothetical protein
MRERNVTQRNQKNNRNVRNYNRKMFEQVVTNAGSYNWHLPEPVRLPYNDKRKMIDTGNCFKDKNENLDCNNYKL